MTNNFQQESEDLIREKDGANNLGDSTQKSELVCPMPTANTKEETANSQIARAASIVMIAYIFSTLVGVVRGMVISRAFGTSPELDSYNAANRVTELLFNLTAGGALGSAFIPMFTGMLTRGDKRSAWKLASGVMNTIIVILILVTLVMWVFAPQIVEYGLFALAHGNPGQVELTVKLLRIMLPTVIIFGMSGLMMGMLNAHQVFLWPALAPAMYSLGLMAGTLLLPESLGIERLAIGAVLGALGHWLLQIPSLFRLPDRFYDRMVWFKDQAVCRVLKLMLPRVIGAGVVQFNFVANTIIGLSLGEGSASALTWAFTLMLMPQAAIAQSAGIASLPTLSAQVELGYKEEFRKTLAGILRAMLLLALPATVGLITLRIPLIRVLYERGSFDTHSTEMVAWALLWYAIGLTGHSLVEVLSRAFYAMHDTRTPVTVGVIAMTGNILLSFAFSHLFGQLGWLPLGGLALANSFATAVECVALLLILRKRIEGIEGRRILSSALKALGASAVMGLVLYGWMRVFGQRNQLIVLVLGAGLGFLVYVAILWFLKVPELWAVIGRIKGKLAEKG